MSEFDQLRQQIASVVEANQRLSREVSRLTSEVDVLRAQMPVLSPPKASVSSNGEEVDNGTHDTVVANGETSASDELPPDNPDTPYWEKSTVWRFFAHWVQNHTTTHGIPSIARPDGQPLYRRVCWFMLFTASMIMLILQLWPIVMGHLAYQTGSVETRSFAPGLRGPAITICPSNSVKCTCEAWSMTPALAQLQCVGALNDSVSLTPRALAVFASAGWHPATFYAARERTRACGLNVVSGRSVSTGDIIAQANAGAIDGVDLLIYGAYNWDELIDECYSYADTLSCQDEHYWEPLFINNLLCWTINGPSYVPDGPDDAQFVCNRSGIDGAVKFTVRHNLPTYVSYEDAVGASLVLHHQTVSAANHPEEQLLDPQKNIIMSYEMQNITLLGAPFTPDCDPTPPQPYSIEQCLERCFYQLVLEQCGCQFAGAGYNLTGVRFCSFLDNPFCADFPEYCYAIDSDAALCELEEYANAPQCLCGYKIAQLPAAVTDQHHHGCVSDQVAGCRPSCVTTEYAPFQSQNSIPNPTIVIANLDTDDTAYEDVSVITVQARSLNLVQVDQTEANALADTLGAVGGNMGMWAGLSVLSLFETGEALLLLAVTGALGLFRRRQAALRAEAHQQQHKQHQQHQQSALVVVSAVHGSSNGGVPLIEMQTMTQRS